MAVRSDLAFRSEEDQAAFFADVMRRTSRAEAQAGTVSRDLLLAGQHVRLVFAGPALERTIFPALAHLEVDRPGEPDLLLHLWDSATTGVEVAAPPVERHCFSDRGDMWTFHSERWKSAFHVSEYSLNLLDLETGEGIYWLRSADALPAWAAAAPLRSLLAWWLTERGAQLVHGAVVGTEQGGVLIVGKGGVGKSTTALACLAAGFRFVGDDYVVLGNEAGETIAYSLYQTAKLDADTAARFAALAPGTPVAGPAHTEDKSVFSVLESRADQLALNLPIRAVLTPRFGRGAETRLEPASADALLGPAIYTTIAQLPHAGQRSVDLIEAQLRRLPCMTLVLGSDVERVPDAIAGFLAQPQVPIAPAPIACRPLISVVIPVFNGLEFLGEAIGSVLAQDYPKLEIIVVDDGVTEDITARVAALPVEVRLLRKRNGGPADARNTGIRAASGELLAFLDVDDLWPPDMLAVTLAWLDEHPDTDVALGRAQLLRRSGADGVFRFVGSPADNFPFHIAAGLFRRRAFDRNGLFDPELRLAEDTDWFARAAGRLVVDHVDSTTLHVRRHDANITGGRDVAARIPLQLARNVLHRKRGLAP